MEGFRKVFHNKFNPREYIQLGIKNYITIKQNEHSVSDFIIEREVLENTLGSAIFKDLREITFHSNLDMWLKEKLVMFADLPYKQYKRKAESTDQDMWDQSMEPNSQKNSLDSSKSKTNMTTKSTQWNYFSKMTSVIWEIWENEA